MRHLILLPDLGQTTAEAKVLQWRKKPGERIAKGEPVLEVETDKVDMDVESFVDGYLRETLVAEGAVAVALTPVAVVTDTADEPYQPPGEEHENGKQSGPRQAQDRAGTPAGRAEARPQQRRSSKIAAAPAARLLAKELGVDLAQVAGTGPEGLITRRDVQVSADSRTDGTQAPVDASRSWAAMAAMTVESKRTIPHFYATREISVAAEERWRKQWNERRPEAKATFNDAAVWAAARALLDVERINTRLENGGAYVRQQGAHLYLLVARDESLTLVPFSAGRKTGWPDFLSSLRQAVRRGPRAAAAASAAKPVLAMSNLGMYGVREFTAIIPPGCSAALAVGAVRKEPAVSGERIEIDQRCSFTLSADHRIVDGVTAARFLERIEFHLNSLEKNSC